MNLDLTDFRAAIFDLDGTLVVTEHVWQAAKKSVAVHLGAEVSQPVLDAHVGRRLADFTAEVLANHLTGPTQHAEAEAMIIQEARVRMPAEIVVIDGAERLLRDMHDAGLALAICSSSPPEMISVALNVLGVADLIDCVVSAAELPRGKPDPAPYLKALEMLAIPSDQVLAFEDSLAGATSAKAAGLFTVGVGHAAQDDEFKFCDRRFANLGDIRIAGTGRRQSDR